MGDNILDEMSLSDDEMLDSLADDMLMEIAQEKEHEPLEVSTSTWSQSAVSTPSNVAPSVNMPDLSQMMSQMMPMMSRMFGNNNAGSTNSLQQVPVSWQELVKRHVPSNEQEDWLTTIDKDATKLHAARISKTFIKPHSRSYRTTASPMPNVYMEVGTMLANMLNEAVCSAQLEHNRQWQELKDGVVSHLAQTGMTKVFENKFKEMLRQHVANDPDYLAEKDSERYCNITKALSV
ncbi:unnamed protein product [Peronospora belbahrii]|uniref:Uncharacterized protein n=1 Tax=Peronospora belbahrii TaxID=622444 RepID=A0ABN8D6H5_9STRA|nr:unnamed protein product [Peronospora belbahrii]